METGARRSGVDSTGRVLSIMSLCVAIASVAYVYYQHRTGAPNEPLVSALEKELAEHASGFTTARQEMKQQFETALNKQDERMENWNSQLTGAIEAFRQDGEALLKRVADDEQLASQQRQQAFRDELAELAQPTGTGDDAGANELSGPRNQSSSGETDPETSPSDVAAADTDASSDRDALLGVARLIAVKTALRTGDHDPRLIVIENEGHQDALIERIRFRPESDFEAAETRGAQVDVGASPTTTIVYGPSDNTSQRAGYHGIYDRQLQEKIRVRAGESLTLRVNIDDARYEGWGFAGRLVLDYNGSEPLSVESARVAFQASDTEDVTARQ
jgi:hypothetical protein